MKINNMKIPDTKPLSSSSFGAFINLIFIFIENDSHLSVFFLPPSLSILSRYTYFSILLFFTFKRKAVLKNKRNKKISKALKIE